VHLVKQVDSVLAQGSSAPVQGLARTARDHLRVVTAACPLGHTTTVVPPQDPASTETTPAQATRIRCRTEAMAAARRDSFLAPQHLYPISCRRRRASSSSRISSTLQRSARRSCRDMAAPRCRMCRRRHPHHLHKQSRHQRMARRRSLVSTVAGRRRRAIWGISALRTPMGRRTTCEVILGA